MIVNTNQQKQTCKQVIMSSYYSVLTWIDMAWLIIYMRSPVNLSAVSHWVTDDCILWWYIEVYLTVNRQSVILYPWRMAISEFGIITGFLA